MSRFHQYCGNKEYRSNFDMVTSINGRKQSTDTQFHTKWIKIITLASKTLNSLLFFALQKSLQRSLGETPAYFGIHCLIFPSKSKYRSLLYCSHCSSLKLLPGKSTNKWLQQNNSKIQSQYSADLGKIFAREFLILNPLISRQSKHSYYRHFPDMSEYCRTGIWPSGPSSKILHFVALALCIPGKRTRHHHHRFWSINPRSSMHPSHHAQVTTKQMDKGFSETLDHGFKYRTLMSVVHDKRLLSSRLGSSSQWHHHISFSLLLHIIIYYYCILFLSSFRIQAFDCTGSSTLIIYDIFSSMDPWHAEKYLNKESLMHLT